MRNKKFKGKNFSMLLLNARTYIALIVLLGFFSIFSPNFLSTTTMILIAKHAAIYAIIGVGMTFIIITGGIDLSVGSIVGISGMIAGGLIYKGLTIGNNIIYFNIPMIIAITLIAGMLFGVINGYLISKLNVPAFIATLGTMYVARGLAMLHSNGETYPNLVGDSKLGNTGFPQLGGGSMLGIPYAIWIMLVIVIVSVYVAKKTPLGWHIFAVGGNEKAAKLSGVKVQKIKMIVYMFSGFCAAIVGLITASELVAAHPAIGESWEMNAIAAAVLGGTSMAGGLGTIGGTLVGALVITVLNDGMVMLGVSSFWQMVIKGLVIVIAVIADQAQRNYQKKISLKKQQEIEKEKDSKVEVANIQ